MGRIGSCLSGWFVRKTKQGQWTQDNMRIAADKALAKQVTIRKAAKIYNVPYTSLQKRVTFSRGVVKNRGGQQTMDRNTEMKLANWLTIYQDVVLESLQKLFESTVLNL
ncbi:hypothetical protein ILUMI_09481 [Ignelater luminosus]|uniref:HTH psq-type domain-containing protein n=1 Tax=Ignelater luminosus TaxID=2038154 RepID=A0A8K0CZX1_IGNLU|nr:hypothetical protein ILUMI_09481 [Ignelater luminosus]